MDHFGPWIFFTRKRQGRSFRSGTSLNLTEPDDDDDRVMAKGTGLKSCRLIIRSRDEWGRVEGSLCIGECRVCISQSTLVFLEFVSGVSTSFNMFQHVLTSVVVVLVSLFWLNVDCVGTLGIMNRCKVNGVVQRGCAWGTWFAWEKAPSLNLQAIYLAFRMGKCVGRPASIGW